MDRGLVGGELAVADELLDQAVVDGDLAELAVAQEVGARVADVADEEGAAGHERRRGERGAHAAERGVGERLGEDGLVGVLRSPRATGARG